MFNNLSSRSTVIFILHKKKKEIQKMGCPSAWAVFKGIIFAVFGVVFLVWAVSSIYTNLGLNKVVPEEVNKYMPSQPTSPVSAPIPGTGTSPGDYLPGGGGGFGSGACSGVALASWMQNITFSPLGQISSPDARVFWNKSGVFHEAMGVATRLVGPSPSPGPSPVPSPSPSPSPSSIRPARLVLSLAGPFVQQMSSVFISVAENTAPTVVLDRGGVKQGIPGVFGLAVRASMALVSSSSSSSSLLLPEPALVVCALVIPGAPFAPVALVVTDTKRPAQPVPVQITLAAALPAPFFVSYPSAPMLKCTLSPANANANANANYTLVTSDMVIDWTES